MASRDRKTAECTNCSPGGKYAYFTKEVDWDRTEEGAAIEDWEYEWVCTNCGHSHPFRNASSKGLGKNVTPSQRRALAKIEREVADRWNHLDDVDVKVEWDHDPSNGQILGRLMGTPWFDDSPGVFQIGIMGKVTWHG